jgi:hypothetical protein
MFCRRGNTQYKGQQDGLPWSPGTRNITDYLSNRGNGRHAPEVDLHLLSAVVCAAFWCRGLVTKLVMWMWQSRAGVPKLFVPSVMKSKKSLASHAKETWKMHNLNLYCWLKRKYLVQLGCINFTLKRCVTQGCSKLAFNYAATVYSVSKKYTHFNEVCTVSQKSIHTLMKNVYGHIQRGIRT